MPVLLPGNLAVPFYSRSRLYARPLSLTHGGLLTVEQDCWIHVCHSGKAVLHLLQMCISRAVWGKPALTSPDATHRCKKTNPSYMLQCSTRPVGQSLSYAALLARIRNSDMHRLAPAAIVFVLVVQMSAEGTSTDCSKYLLSCQDTNHIYAVTLSTACQLL